MTAPNEEAPDIVERLNACRHGLFWPEARDAASEIATLRQQNEALREIVSESASAIGNGARIAPQCSIEFMQGLPREIALHTTALRQQLEEARALAYAATNKGPMLWRDIAFDAFDKSEQNRSIVRQAKLELGWKYNELMELVPPLGSNREE